ncbi:MAG: c-type cytochrome [Actinobacteria bacterium]|nr:c-type cytochrome [Actinomycetota bacterium]
MTEIPEHLLKRSKARRAAMGLPGGEGDDGGDAAASGTGAAPAAAAAAPPAAKAPARAEQAQPVAPAAPPPPKPVPAYVAAAQRRRRIPYWAMPVLVALPVWGFIYWNSVQVPTTTDDALTTGQSVFGSCSGCHGAAGQGGTGAKLAGGEVLKTFPDPKAMMQWINLGAEKWTGKTGSAANAIYGDPKRPGGPHNTATLSGEAMPAFPDLSAAELAAVTRYVRETLSGAPDESEVITPELAQEAIDDAQKGKLVYKNEKPDPKRVKASTKVG